VGFLGRPRQGVVYFAGVDQRADELALLGGARQGGEQREQLLAVPGSGIVLERPAERQVLGLGLLGDLVDVSRDESEGYSASRLFSAR